MTLGISYLRFFGAVIFVAACAGGGSGANNDAAAGASSAGGKTGAGGAGVGIGGSPAGGSPGAGGSFGIGAGGSGGGGIQGKPLVYVHSNTTLYQFDPTVMPYSLAMIGAFDCIGGAGQDTSMTDFAVNAAGVLYGVSQTKAYVLEIQGSVVHCKATIALPTKLPSGKTTVFYALSIAPAGVVGPAEAVITGNTDGELWAIDDQGNATQHGNFGVVPAKDQNGYAFPNSGKQWELSGDIVFLDNGGSPVGFATVRDCPKPPASTSCNTDTLIEIDVGAMKAVGNQSVLKSVRGKIEKAAGCADPTSSYGSMYGIAAFNDQIFGFSNKGEFVTISNKDGTACLVQSFAMEKWAGAGVTTIAPVIAPPPVPM